MSLRHFRSGLAAVETDTIQLELRECTAEKLIFVNPKDARPKRIVYEREGKDRLIVNVETEREGRPVTFTLRFVHDNAGA